MKITNKDQYEKTRIEILAIDRFETDYYCVRSHTAVEVAAHHHRRQRRIELVTEMIKWDARSKGLLERPIKQARLNSGHL